jgi:rubrerythrin
MGPVEALKLALSKEIEAKQMYEDFSIKFPAAKDIFEFLLGEEIKHKLLIERKIIELTK